MKLFKIMLFLIVLVVISLGLINTTNAQSRGRTRGTEKKSAPVEARPQVTDAQKTPDLPKRRITIYLIEGEPINGVFLQASPASIQIEVAGNILNIKWTDVSRVIFPDSPDKAGQSLEDTSTSTKPESSAVTAALKALRKLAGATEVGISFQEYGTRLIDVKADVDEALTQVPDGEIRNEIKLAMEAFVDAGQGWNASLGRHETLFPELEPGRSLMIKYSIPIDNSIGMPLLPRARVLTTIWAAARSHIERASTSGQNSKSPAGASNANDVSKLVENSSPTTATPVSDSLLAGAWAIRMTGPNGQSISATLTITGTRNSYMAVLQGQDGSNNFSMSSDGNKFSASFMDQIDSRPVSMTINGNIQGDSISGSIKATTSNIQSSTIFFSGTKVK